MDAFKTHDELRHDLKIRLGEMLAARGAVTRLSEKTKIPKTSIYTWVGNRKKAIPDSVDAYLISVKEKITIEELVDGDDGRDYILKWASEHGAWRPPERIADIVDDLNIVSDDMLDNVRNLIHPKAEKIRSAKSTATA